MLPTRITRILSFVVDRICGHRGTVEIGARIPPPPPSGAPEKIFGERPYIPPPPHTHTHIEVCPVRLCFRVSGRNQCYI